MPDLTRPVPSAGVELLRQSLGQVQSAIAAVLAELEWARRASPDRLPGIVLRAHSLAGLAREASAIAAESLGAVAGLAPAIPDLSPESAAKGSGRHRRADTWPGDATDETDPGEPSW